jgi:hypothetical protein
MSGGCAVLAAGERACRSWRQVLKALHQMSALFTNFKQEGSGEVAVNFIQFMYINTLHSFAL